MNRSIIAKLKTDSACREKIESAEKDILSGPYIGIGIYDQGEIVTTRDPKKCFLECTWDLAFIRKLTGAPRSGPMGLKYWARYFVDCVILDLDDVRAWDIAHRNGWLADVRGSIDYDEPRRTPLRWALENTRIQNPDVFDFLFEKYPDTKLDDMCWRAGTAAAARWLCQEPHKADPYYDGLRHSMQSSTKAFPKPETPQILEIFYGKDDARP